MASSNGKMGGMEANIKNLAESFDKMRLYILDKEHFKEEQENRREAETRDFRDRLNQMHTSMIMDIAVIKSNQVDMQRSVDKYQGICDKDRKDHDDRLSSLETERATRNGAMRAYTCMAGAIGGCIGYIIEYITGVHR
jgi:hypothetical protein